MNACAEWRYLLTPRSRVPLEKLTGFAANQEIPRILWNPKFIAVLTNARHLSLSWANSIQSPQPLHTSSRPILILSSHLRLGLPNGLFPSGFPTKRCGGTAPWVPICTVDGGERSSWSPSRSPPYSPRYPLVRRRGGLQQPFLALCRRE